MKEIKPKRKINTKDSDDGNLPSRRARERNDDVDEEIQIKNLKRKIVKTAIDKKDKK